MWKLLILLMFSFNLTAAESKFQKLLDEKINIVKKEITASKSFEEKIARLASLQNQLRVVESKYTPDDVKNNPSDFHSISIAMTALELNDLENLEIEKCELALNKIAVAFDPKSQTNPKLPHYAKEIYNLLALSCQQGPLK